MNIKRNLTVIVFCKDKNNGILGEVEKYYCITLRFDLSGLNCFMHYVFDSEILCEQIPGHCSLKKKTRRIVTIL